MGTLARYHAANLPELMEKITRNSIGMDDYLNRFWDGVDTTSNYPPYNLVQVNNVESRLERKMKSKSIRSLENYMWKARRKNQRMMENLSIKDWPKGLSIGSGRSQMIMKYEMQNSAMDCWWYD